MNERAIKLLELAIHSSTGDGERSNAVSMFRNMADKAGGLRKLLDAAPANKQDADSYWFDQYQGLKKKVGEDAQKHRAAADHIERLSRERDAALRRYTALRNSLSAITSEGNDLNDPAAALYGGLTHEWRTITQIHEAAFRNGFKGVEGTLRKRADNLAAKGLIDVREAFEGGYGIWEPRAWRHKV